MPLPVMLGVALTGLGAAVSAYGAYQQGQAASKMHNHNAALAAQRAKIERQNAAFAAGRHETAMRRLQGSQRAAYGASGITLFGSPTDVDMDTQTQGELDRLMIIYGGEVGAYEAEAESAKQRYAARAAKHNAKVSALSTAITGASNVYGMGHSLKLW